MRTKDIYFLGGVMHRAQEIISGEYHVDIATRRTLSAQAMHILLSKYYNDVESPYFTSPQVTEARSFESQSLLVP